MKKTLTLLPVVFWSLMLLAGAADVQPQPTVHRLEYIHYNTVAHSVEWGVSEGTMNDAGDFLPSETPVATYSMNLQSGIMTHDGEISRLSPRDDYDAFRAFQALSMLMQVYTQSWDSPGVPNVQQGSGDPDVQDSSGDISVSRISQSGSAMALPSRPGCLDRSAKDALQGKRKLAKGLL